ncbi:MAG: prepilin peptidase [Propionibacterium sp.]
MTGLQWALDAALAVALVFWHARVLLPRQPEPEPGTPGAATKTPYAALASWRFTAVCAALAALCQLAGLFGEQAHRPLWLVWGSGVLVLAGVDARSTWLPRRLTWCCLAQLGVAICVAALWGDDPGMVLDAALGGLVMGSLFWLLWRAGAGLGFGDVRLALGLGALAGAVSAEFWFTALLSASLVGAVWGLVCALGHGRDRPFAYGPALWTGPWAAQLWMLLG